MVNPSTADAVTDDATIRRVVGFGIRFGWSKVIVVNVFAYRATDVRVLAQVPDPIGPDNAQHLRLILDEAEVALVAWGSLSKLPLALRDEWRNVSAIAGAAGKQLKCLGVANDGHPRHPLMLSYQSKVADWRVP